MYPISRMDECIDSIGDENVSLPSKQTAATGSSCYFKAIAKRLLSQPTIGHIRLKECLSVSEILRKRSSQHWEWKLATSLIRRLNFLQPDFLRQSLSPTARSPTLAAGRSFNPSTQLFSV